MMLSHFWLRDEQGREEIWAEVSGELEQYVSEDASYSIHSAAGIWEVDPRCWRARMDLVHLLLRLVSTCQHHTRLVRHVTVYTASVNRPCQAPTDIPTSRLTASNVRSTAIHATLNSDMCWLA